MSRVAVLPTAKPGASSTKIRESILITAQTAGESATLPPLPHLAFANFFVAARSGRRLILAGPSGSGKLALARLVSELVGGAKRMKAMVGHARWAAGSAQSAMLVEAQTCLNKNALFGLIEEAWQPEQQHRPYVACLERISPAELDSFFTPEGLDLLYRQFLGWRATKGLPQLPLPPNLTLIATFDTERFRWWDISLVDSVLVVPWPASSFHPSSQLRAWERPGLCGGSFLRDSVREPGMAHTRQPADIHARVLTFLDDAYEPLVTLLIGSKAA